VGTCACYLYIRMAEEIVRIRPPDRNDDGARRVARKKGCDPRYGTNPAVRCSLTESEMRTVVVIVADAISEQPFQMAFI
jgi:hypothetical protein